METRSKCTATPLFNELVEVKESDEESEVEVHQFENDSSSEEKLDAAIAGDRPIQYNG